MKQKKLRIKNLFTLMSMALNSFDDDERLIPLYLAVTIYLFQCRT